MPHVVLSSSPLVLLQFYSALWLSPHHENVHAAPLPGVYGILKTGRTPNATMKPDFMKLLLTQKQKNQNRYENVEVNIGVS